MAYDEAEAFLSVRSAGGAFPARPSEMTSVPGTGNAGAVGADTHDDITQAREDPAAGRRFGTVHGYDGPPFKPRGRRR